MLFSFTFLRDFCFFDDGKKRFWHTWLFFSATVRCCCCLCSFVYFWQVKFMVFVKRLCLKLFGCCYILWSLLQVDLQFIFDIFFYHLLTVIMSRVSSFTLDALLFDFYSRFTSRLNDIFQFRLTFPGHLRGQKAQKILCGARIQTSSF